MISMLGYHFLTLFLLDSVPRTILLWDWNRTAHTANLALEFLFHQMKNPKIRRQEHSFFHTLEVWCCITLLKPCSDFTLLLSYLSIRREWWLFTTQSYGENKTTKFWGTLRWRSSKKDKKVATQPLHPFSFRTELKGTESKQGVRPHADQKERRKK